MATNNMIKFFKGANAPAAPVAGMIWFCTSDRTIRVYTGSEWEKYAGLVDAGWNATDKKLTITSAAGTTTTLDLSDCASASDLATKLQTINNTLDSHNTRINTAQAAAEGAQAHSEGVASDLAAEVKLRGEEITRVEGLVSAEASRADAAEKANAAAAKAAADKAAAAQTYAEGVNTALGQEVERAEGVEKDLDDRLKLVEGAIGDGGSVADAIKNAIEALDTPDAGVKGDGTHVDVTVKQVNGVITEVVVGESDIASAQTLADEIANRAADEQAINARIDALDAAGDAEGNGKGRVTILEEQVRALNSATHFEGKVEGDSLEAAIAASGKTYQSGDIVIYGNKEYIYDGSNWIELGDTTDEQSRLSALEGLVGTTSVDAQIDAKIGALDATVGEAAVAEGKHVAVQVVEIDGVLTALTVSEKDIASAAKLSEIEGEVDLNTEAVADHKTRIEALEATKNALDSTYVKVSDYSVDKAALQGDIDAAEGRLDTAEGEIDTLQAAIERLDGEQATQNTNIEAAAALGQKGIDDAAAALAEAQAKVKSVSGDADVNASTTDHAVSLSLNKATAVAEGDTKAVTAGAVFEAMCWVEFN